MKKLFLFALFIASVQAGYTQINFERGYFINNNGDTTSCFIRDAGWMNTPKEFQYRFKETEEPLTGKMINIKEFALENGSKYQRYTVNIDSSSNKIEELSWNPSPEFRSETVFLKLLVDGKAKLFLFQRAGMKRFFYSLGATELEPLVFKEYRNAETSILSNTTYLQQVSNALKDCAVVTDRKINSSSYEENDLIYLFRLYNNCGDPSAVKRKENKRYVHLNLRPGLSNGTLEISNEYLGITDFGSANSVRLGIEAEIELPFNKNKWTIIVEPSYQQFKSTVKKNNKTNIADYRSIDIGLGIRHHFYIGKQSRIFLDAGYSYGLPLQRTLNEEKTPDLEVAGKGNLSLGGGFAYRRFEVELRAGLSRNILAGSYVFYTSNYSTTAVIASYRLF